MQGKLIQALFCFPPSGPWTLLVWLNLSLYRGSWIPEKFEWLPSGKSASNIVATFHSRWIPASPSLDRGWHLWFGTNKCKTVLNTVGASCPRVSGSLHLLSLSSMFSDGLRESWAIVRSWGWIESSSAPSYLQDTMLSTFPNATLHLAFCIFPSLKPLCNEVAMATSRNSVAAKRVTQVL